MEPSQQLAGIAGAGVGPGAEPASRRATSVATPPWAGPSPWWQGAPWLALLLIVVGAVRLHELVPALRILQPAILTTVGGTGLLLLKTRRPVRRRLARHPLMRLVFAFWAFMVVTVPFALYSAQALGIAKFFLPALVLLATILVCQPDRPTLRRLQSGMVLATGIYALYVVLFGSARGDRLDAGLGAYDSNDMAALLALTLPLAAGLIRTGRGWERIVVTATAVLLLLTAVESGSRGGALGLGAGAAVFVLGMKGTRRIAGIAILAVSALMVWSYAPGFQERMSTLANLESDYNTTHEYGRKAVWKRGRQYIREHPIIGVGAGNYPIAEGEYFAETYSGLRGGKWSAAHNAYVQAFAELGILGGSLFVGILLYGLRHAWRLWRGVRAGGRLVMHRPEFLASLCAYLVSAVFLSHAYFIPMVALMGLIALASATATADRRAYRARMAMSDAPARPDVGRPAAFGSTARGWVE